MNHFEKYCVDDLVLADKTNESIKDAILILTQYIGTGKKYREKIALALQNNGLAALANHVLNPDDYEQFLPLAKQEQAERLKSRSFSEIIQYPYLPEEKQLQEAKKRHENCERQYETERLKMTERHKQELNILTSRQQREAYTLQKKKEMELKSIQGQIKEAEHQVRLQSDPQYATAYYAEQKRKQEEKERAEAEQRLLHSFGLNQLAQKDKPMLFPILRKLDVNERLTIEDIDWLETDGKDYFRKDGKIYQTHHRIEADYYLSLYDKEKSTWHAINASSHLRKSKQAPRAEALLAEIAQGKIKNEKSKSAFLTTFGGVKRDLHKFAEGMEMAGTAHYLTPKDYRPCTLLGALHIEIRQFKEGSAWFAKAEKLGAKRDDIDTEIKSLYHKADKETKEKLKAHLLKTNPKRYAWLNKGNNSGKNKARPSTPIK